MCDLKQDPPLYTEKKKYKIEIMGDQIKVIDKASGEVYAVIHAVNGKLRGDKTENQYAGTVKEEETEYFLTCNRIFEEAIQVNVYCKSPFISIIDEKAMFASYEEVLDEYVMEYPTREKEFEISFQLN